MLAAGTISKRCQEISRPVIAARIATNIHTANICQRVSGCLDYPGALLLVVKSISGWFVESSGKSSPTMAYFSPRCAPLLSSGSASDSTQTKPDQPPAPP
jgi:hypothetical protein